MPEIWIWMAERMKAGKWKQDGEASISVQEPVEVTQKPIVSFQKMSDAIGMLSWPAWHDGNKVHMMKFNEFFGSQNSCWQDWNNIDCPGYFWRTREFLITQLPVSLFWSMDNIFQSIDRIQGKKIINKIFIGRDEGCINNQGFNKILSEDHKAGNLALEQSSRKLTLPF